MTFISNFYQYKDVGKMYDVFQKKLIDIIDKMLHI